MSVATASLPENTKEMFSRNIIGFVKKISSSILPGWKTKYWTKNLVCFTWFTLSLLAFRHTQLLSLINRFTYDSLVGCIHFITYCMGGGSAIFKVGFCVYRKQNFFYFWRSSFWHLYYIRWKSGFSFLILRHLKIYRDLEKLWIHFNKLLSIRAALEIIMITHGVRSGSFGSRGWASPSVTYILFCFVIEVVWQNVVWLESVCKAQVYHWIPLCKKKKKIPLIDTCWMVTKTKW